ncbi:MAG: CPBP family intramembrane glutamic endopeptidase [Candidatus Micrarchaeota archaeon]
MATIADLANALFLPLLLFFIPFLILKLGGKSLPKSLQYLFVNKSDYSPFSGLPATIAYAFILVIAMLALTALESAVLFQLGLLDLDKVSELIKRQTSIVLIVAMFVSPIAEEVFFRGLLQRRFGMLFSAAAFGISHALYNSVAEIVGAFTLGLLLSFYVAKRKSIAAPILAHMFYNLLSIASLTWQ